MTSLAQIHQPSKISTPFSVMCSFEVPSSEVDPSIIPSRSVCIGKYETQEQARQAFLTLEAHPALISAWCWQSLRD